VYHYSNAVVHEPFEETHSVLGGKMHQGMQSDSSPVSIMKGERVGGYDDPKEDV